MMKSFWLFGIYFQSKRLHLFSCDEVFVDPLGNDLAHVKASFYVIG